MKNQTGKVWVIFTVCEENKNVVYSENEWCDGKINGNKLNVIIIISH